MSTPVVAAVLVPLMAGVFGLVVSVPPSQVPGTHAAAEGPYAVFWSALDDCFGRGGEDAAVCLKYKALIAVDRVLGDPSPVVADGVSLTARAGDSPGPDDPPRTVRRDLAVVDAVRDPGRKSALLDDMLASRVEEFASAVVTDDGEGRGKKKSKTMKQAIMMASMMAAAFIGPMVLKVITLIATKAFVVSKIALILSSFMAIKKLLSQKQKSSHEIKPTMAHRSARTMRFNTQDMAYSEQKQ